MKTTKDPLAQRLDAQVREADARLDLMQAQAEARQAKDEMAEISGLRAASDRARKAIDDLKLKASKDAEAARKEVETAVHELEGGIERARTQYGSWDEARERGFNARLDKAEARLRIWKAQADKTVATKSMKAHDKLATLEERIALARARSAEAAQYRHDRKAQEAFEDAAHHFDEAYDAAAKHYEK